VRSQKVLDKQKQDYFPLTTYLAKNFNLSPLPIFKLTILWNHFDESCPPPPHTLNINLNHQIDTFWRSYYPLDSSTLYFDYHLHKFLIGLCDTCI